ncbi:MAG: type II secretion system protein GspG [Myxococcales bacterium]|nr:type II secretion system protein GspG [Myxococcales bacterium]MCB9756072.1 type II secretion system protein GspG [Myxococcales bacterium]
MHIHAHNPALRRAAFKASRGMTLIEILVVLAIIGLIVGGVSVMAFGQLEKAQLKNTGSEVIQIQSHCQMYMMQQQNKCPTSMSDLKAAGITSRVKKDAWGNDYVIMCPGEHDRCDVKSWGPDGADGTEDDIKSWEAPGADSGAEDAKK